MESSTHSDQSVAKLFTGTSGLMKRLTEDFTLSNILDVSLFSYLLSYLDGIRDSVV